MEIRITPEQFKELRTVEIGEEGAKSSEWITKVNDNEYRGRYYILPRDIENGVYFDTLIMVPNRLNSKTRIALTIRNTGSPTEKTALRDGKNIKYLTDEDMKSFYPSNRENSLEAIYSNVSSHNELLVIPLIIQEYEGPYYQQLTRESIKSEEEGFKRVDKQILKAVDRIREIFGELGIEIPEKMDLIGQSASGSFVDRFGKLYLDRVNSCCTNGAKDAMMLLESEIEGQELAYPIGIADYQEIAGREFDKESAKKIPMLVTYGILEDEIPWRYDKFDEDGNIISNYDKTRLIGSMTPQDEADIWQKTMGKTQAERMLATLKTYKKEGYNLTMLGFLEYGHGLGRGTYEVSRGMIELANEEDESNMAEKQARMIQEIKQKYEILDLADIIGNEELERMFIAYSEGLAVIRNKVADLTNYRLKKWGNDRLSHDDDEVRSRIEDLEEEENKCKGKFKKLIELSRAVKALENGENYNTTQIINGVEYDVRIIAPDKENGVNIPGIVLIPKVENMQIRIALESNNCEYQPNSNSFCRLIEQGNETGKRLASLTNVHFSPIVVPILPGSNEGPYFQQLSRECFALDKTDQNYRIDEQVVKMLDKTRDILKTEYGVTADEKIFLNGYSSSGVFAQRFAEIHPKLVDTLCVGGASGSIPVPTKKLKYPIGIGDFFELFGEEFDMDNYKAINMIYYEGEHESERKTDERIDETGSPAPMHDMSYYDRSVPCDVGKAQRALLGKEMRTRANKSVDALKHIGVNVEYIIIRRKRPQQSRKNPRRQRKGGSNY